MVGVRVAQILVDRQLHHGVKSLKVSQHVKKSISWRESGLLFLRTIYKK